MSTRFGILTEDIPHNNLVDSDGDLHFYISRSIFEPIFFRGNESRWLNVLAQKLTDDTKVYALDNTQQGVYTIKDCKELIDGK